MQVPRRRLGAFHFRQDLLTDDTRVSLKFRLIGRRERPTSCDRNGRAQIRLRLKECFDSGFIP
jgi:hypothetical protein